MHPLDNEALKLGAKAVRRRRLDAENRQDFISLLGRVVVILLCAWVLFTQVFLLTQAKGSSMFPAVKDGDLLICYRLQKTYAKDALEYPYTVPEGCVFVLGDYRTQSEDSRDFGPVPQEDVQAKVITLLRRRSL